MRCLKPTTGIARCAGCWASRQGAAGVCAQRCSRAQPLPRRGGGARRRRTFCYAVFTVCNTQAVGGCTTASNAPSPALPIRAAAAAGAAAAVPRVEVGLDAQRGDLERAHRHAGARLHPAAGGHHRKGGGHVAARGARPGQVGLSMRSARGACSSRGGRRPAAPGLGQPPAAPLPSRCWPGWRAAAPCVSWLSLPPGPFSGACCLDRDSILLSLPPPTPILRPTHPVYTAFLLPAWQDLVRLPPAAGNAAPAPSAAPALRTPHAALCTPPPCPSSHPCAALRAGGGARNPPPFPPAPITPLHPPKPISFRRSLPLFRHRSVCARASAPLAPCQTPPFSLLLFVHKFPQSDSKNNNRSPAPQTHVTARPHSHPGPCNKPSGPAGKRPSSRESDQEEGGGRGGSGGAPRVCALLAGLPAPWPLTVARFTHGVGW